MQWSDYATVGIAVLSLAVSVTVLLRDRRSRRIDLLYRCYERVMDQYNKRVSTEKSGGSQDVEKARVGTSFDTERELDTTCYLLMKHQFSKRMFWDLFGDWLTGRRIIMNEPKGWLYGWKYTKKAVQYYQRRGYLKAEARN